MSDTPQKGVEGLTSTPHTPGPWTVRNKGEPLVPGLSPERVTAGPLTIAHMETTGVNAEANARLLAAAPDLLQALEHLLTLSGPAAGIPTSRWAQARADAIAALAKAHGGDAE